MSKLELTKNGEICFIGCGSVEGVYSEPQILFQIVAVFQSVSDFSYTLKFFASQIIKITC